MAASTPASPTTKKRSAAKLGARFEGKVALITGASEQGIGGAVAERLLEEGASVCLMSRSEPAGLLEKHAGDDKESRAQWIKCDLAQADTIGPAVEAAVQAFGSLDVLVNNSGIDTSGAFADLKDEEWQQMLDVNLSGAIRVTQAAMPALLKSKGSVVNVASATAMGGTPGLAAYSATKAGMVGFTQSLAAEVAPRRVRVNAVCPAIVKTPMTTQYAQQLNAETWQQLQACHPMGIGKPADVAAAVAFLASSDARWITGIALPLGWMSSFSMPMAE